MAVSVLTPLQLNAGAGLLQNQGIGVGSTFTAAIVDYESQPGIANLITTIQTANSVGNIGNATVASLQTLASNSCPALADSIPTGYSFTNSVATPGLTGFLKITANTYAGNGDLGKFAQAFSAADGYAYQTNLFLNSAINSQTYLGNTFTGMNNMITGDITSINLATGPFGQDLANLGQLIDLNNLGDLGSPLALVQRVVNIVGNVPLLGLIFVTEGVPEEVVVNISNPATSITDSAQKLLYQAMTKITGDLLEQILAALNVTTVGINTMADLLNPLKLFPNSFQSLTTSTSVGPRAIYLDSAGTVNSNLINQLPEYVIKSVI